MSEKTSNDKTVISPSHILTMSVQGSLVKLKMTSVVSSPPSPSRRGVISEFSRKSRKRLLDLMATLDLDNALRAHPAIFITLTYGQSYPSNKLSNAHLEAFKKRLIRFAPQCSAIWRREQQKRGAPHFHFMVFNLPFLPKDDLSTWWHEIIGDEYADNSVSPARAPFTRIETIRSARQCVRYVSKYIAKTPDDISSDAGASPIFERDAPRDDDENNDVGGSGSGGFNSVPNLDNDENDASFLGRAWGVINRKKLPFAELFQQVLPASSVVLRALFAFRRLVKRKGQNTGFVARYKHFSGVTLYAWDCALQWWRAWGYSLGYAIGDDF